ncbi:MAG: VTT domain-containing protein [Promethearchaeota archaeon]
MANSEHSKIKTNIFLLIFLLIIVIITILSALNPDFGELFSIYNWFNSEALSEVPIWVAIGFTALVCFLGALVPIPIPYALPITIFSAIWIKQYGLSGWILIIVLVLFATLANTIGDLLDYFIGDGTQRVLSKDNPELQNRWSQIILKKPKAIPGVILLFGLTPLPDSLLMVPLGMVKYNIKKTMVYMFVGRFFMLFAFALAGVFALNMLIIEGGDDNGTGWIIGVVILYIIWALIVLMVKIKPKEKEPTILKEDAGNDNSS